MRWVGLLAEVPIVWLVCNVCIARSERDEYGVDVAKLAALTQGTELLVLENALHNQKTYRLEDFFWTGSGDGSVEEEEKTSWNSPEATTVYSTKTVLSTSTVFMTPTIFPNQTEFPCTSDCDPIANQTDDVGPTPTFADRQFWLLTVLKSDGKDPDVAELKKRLAALYKKAFLRWQQAKHLGIQAKTKREAKPEKPISVYLHKVEKLPEKIEVVYHVSVSGQPVDAVTASEDMQLVTDEEVKEELGFPFLIKAEPYIKPSTPQELALDKPNWIYIGVSTVIVLLSLLLVIIFATWVTKQKRPLRDENIRQVFQGEENLGFDEEPRKYRSGRRNQHPSPTYINFRSQPSNATLLSGVNLVRPGSSTSSSGSSVDISPLMGLGKQRGEGKKVLRPKAAINKTVPIVPNRSSLSLDTESSSMTRSQDTVFIGNYDPGVVSPKSYLSMPSIKSFPRSNNPEPLNKVLEPVSVLHLDMNDDVSYEPKEVDYSMFTRHGSVGTSEDPGVIGPVVWNMHCHRLQHGVSVDGGMDEMKMPVNVSKMRKRFHDLLDDTFSLFGSRKDSPEKDNWRIETKSHPDVDRSFEVPTLRVRPKTTDLKRSNFSSPPKGAWTSSAPSPLVRPVSAPFVRPNTAPNEADHGLAALGAGDPAVPLIAAIRKELGRCALPGSTTNLNE